MKKNDPLNIEGKVIAIIGATGILGSQYVEYLSAKKAKIVIGDVDLQKCEILAERMKKDFHADCSPLFIDNYQEETIVNFFSSLLQKYSCLDVLINNSQVKPDNFYAPFELYSKDTLMKVLDGNLVGVIMACREATKIFIRQGYGNIINISSIYGNTGADQRIYEGVENLYFPGTAFSSPVSYAVSKAGIVGLTKYLASYYREKNIRINCLTPGGVYDNHAEQFNKNYSSRTLLGRMADREEYNGAMLFLASDASSYMTGANLIIDGGWTAI